MDCGAVCRVSTAHLPGSLGGDGCSTVSSSIAAAVASPRSCFSPQPVSLVAVGCARAVSGRGVRDSLLSKPGSSGADRAFANPGWGYGVTAPRDRSVKVSASKQTFKSFDDMLSNSDLPILVDFYATWCGPCQYMVPVLNEVGRALKDELRIVKIDTEKYPQVASRYGVQALPTFIIFRDGQPIDRLEGALPADKLITHVKNVLYGSRAKARN